MKPREITDRILVEQILEGNTQAFNTVISNTQGLVIGIINKMIADPEDRKDLTQEVYLKSYEKLSSFKFNSKLSTWIGAITYNTCLKFLSKKKIPIFDFDQDERDNSKYGLEKEIPSDNFNSTEKQIFNLDRSRILEKEINKLPTIYKTIITLFHHQELSYKEIEVITKLPEGTLKNYLYRARKRLRESLLINYKKEDL